MSIVSTIKMTARHSWSWAGKPAGREAGTGQRGGSGEPKSNTGSFACRGSVDLLARAARQGKEAGPRLWRCQHDLRRVQRPPPGPDFLLEQTSSSRRPKGIGRSAGFVRRDHQPIQRHDQPARQVQAVRECRREVLLDRRSARKPWKASNSPAASTAPPVKRKASETIKLPPFEDMEIPLAELWQPEK